MTKKKGQSTVEYIVLVTAVVGVAIAFMMSNGSPFQSRLGKVLDTMSNQMVNTASRLTGAL